MECKKIVVDVIRGYLTGVWFEMETIMTGKCKSQTGKSPVSTTI